MPAQPLRAPARNQVPAGRPTDSAATDLVRAEANDPIPYGAGIHFCFGRSSESGFRIRSIGWIAGDCPAASESGFRIRSIGWIAGDCPRRPKADAETVASGRDRSDFWWRSFSDDSELAAVRRGWRFGAACDLARLAIWRGAREGAARSRRARPGGSARLAPSPIPPGRAPSGRCRARSRAARRRGTRGRAR